MSKRLTVTLREIASHNYADSAESAKKKCTVVGVSRSKVSPAIDCLPCPPLPRRAIYSGVKSPPKTTSGVFMFSPQNLYLEGRIDK